MHYNEEGSVGGKQLLESSMTERINIFLMRCQKNKIGQKPVKERWQ